METTPRERHTHFPGFDHEGRHITNPTASDAGAVSPAHYGFELWTTGGGCTAWGKVLSDGTEILVTDLDGTSHEVGEPGEPFLVGLHLTDAYEQLGIWTMAVGKVYEPDDQPENEQEPAASAISAQAGPKA